jgi:hypothetical protein
MLPPRRGTGQQKSHADEDDPATGDREGVRDARFDQRHHDDGGPGKQGE